MKNLIESDYRHAQPGQSGPGTVDYLDLNTRRPLFASTRTTLVRRGADCGTPESPASRTLPADNRKRLRVKQTRICMF